MVRDLPDDMYGCGTGDKAHKVVEKPVPDPHEGIANRSFTRVFEPSGNRNAVDKSEYERNYADFDHGIESKKEGSGIAHPRLMGGIFSRLYFPATSSAAARWIWSILS
jgi:hypothetical protein